MLRWGLKKFGLYGLLQIGLPLLPAGSTQWGFWLLLLGLGNVLIIGLVTLAQKRSKANDCLRFSYAYGLRFYWFGNVLYSWFRGRNALAGRAWLICGTLIFTGNLYCSTIQQL